RSRGRRVNTADPRPSYTSRGRRLPRGTYAPSHLSHGDSTMSTFRNRFTVCAGWLREAQAASPRGLRGSRSPHRRPFTPQVELLEDRSLLAAPTVVDPNLAVRTVVSGLDQPTSMAFLGDNDFLVLEKATGKVQHVVNGAVHGTALDLAVNN